MVPIIAVFISLCGLAYCSPSARHDMKVHEARTVVPQGFQSNGPAAPSKILQLRLLLRQNNMDGLIDKVYDVSTPSSKNYGKYLSKEEASQAF